MKHKEKIDFSDIHELTAKDFKRARYASPQEVEEGRKAIEAKLGVHRPRRVGRPTKYPGGALRDIHIKLHPSILGWAKREAKKKNIGYQSFLNDFLLTYANAA